MDSRLHEMQKEYQKAKQQHRADAVLQDIAVNTQTGEFRFIFHTGEQQEKAK